MMGVRGLTSFIENNKLLSHRKLYNTKVIIDGNNLCHFIFYHHNLSYKYGGDYDQYYNKCRNFFLLLKDCDVEPLVVLDGGYDPDNRKLPEILRRMSERRDNVERVCVGEDKMVFPILAVEIFIQILGELGIKHVTVDFDADDVTGVLANDLDCPVISNDSDFFVYDLKAGFIPLNFINLTLRVHNIGTGVDRECTKYEKVIQSEYMYIPVMFYQREEFAKMIGNKETFVIPLLATLQGNDYLFESNLGAFYARLKMPSFHRFKYSAYTKIHGRLAAMIEWLSDKSDLNYCVDFVVARLRKDQKIKIRTDILKSVESYSKTDKHVPAHLKSFLNTNDVNDEKQQTNACYQTRCDYYGNRLPDWILEGLMKHELQPMIQNIAVLHTVVHRCQVEILSEISTYQCSEFLRQVTYGIVFQSDLNTDTKDNCDNGVQEYDRAQKTSTEVFVKPVASIVCFGKLPSLHDVPKMSVDDRQCLLLCTLNMSNEGKSLSLYPQSYEDSNKTSDLGSYKDSGLESALYSCKDPNEQSVLYSFKDSDVHTYLQSHNHTGLQPDQTCQDLGLDIQSDLTYNADLHSDQTSKDSTQHSDQQSCKVSDLQSNQVCKDPDLDSDLLLLLGTISYWINHANPKVTAAHVDSLIVSLIILHVKILQWIEERNAQGLSLQKPRLYHQITEAFTAASDKQIHNLLKNLEKYFEEPNHSYKNPRDNDVVHGFAQLQACIQDVICLNQLLMCPFSPINPAFIINSTFMYNLCREIDVHPNSVSYIVEMLDESSPLSQLFLRLKEKVLSLCKDGRFQEKRLG